MPQADDRPEPTDAEAIAMRGVIADGEEAFRDHLIPGDTTEFAAVHEDTLRHLLTLARAGFTAQADMAALRAERDALAGDAERWRALRESSDALVERACRDREALDYGPRDHHPWDCLVDQEPDMADVERDKMRMFLTDLTTPDAPEQVPGEGLAPPGT